MECDVVYGDFEALFPFQNMHVDVHTNQFSKFVCQNGLELLQ
jgi:hypothetical protein